MAVSVFLNVGLLIVDHILTATISINSIFINDDDAA
jgi:hypothetical protein